MPVENVHCISETPKHALMQNHASTRIVATDFEFLASDQALILLSHAKIDAHHTVPT